MRMSGTVSLSDFLIQGDEIRRLTDQIRNGRLPHALLITGPDGIGKKTLATLVSCALLCTSEGDRPCGRCRACLVSSKLEHADQVLLRKGVPLSPEVREGRTTIPVEDVREMIRICGMTPQEGGSRTVLIFDAEAMTVQAQNALLKTLEEPPEKTFFLLVTAHPEALLTTIISRCRMIRLHALPDGRLLDLMRTNGVPEDLALSVIPLADGSPGKAMEFVEREDLQERRREILEIFFQGEKRSEILTRSTQWKNRKNEADFLFSVLESALHQMLGVRFGQMDENSLMASFPRQWNRFMHEAPPSAFSNLFEQILLAKRELQYATNFQAVFEQVLFSFVGEGNRWLQ